MDVRGALHWCRSHAAIYAFLLVDLILVTIFASIGWSVAIWAPIYGLLVGLLVHEHQIRRAREADVDPSGRVTFGLFVLVLGLVTTASGLATVDWLVFIGVSGFVIAGGLLYGELRRARWRPRYTGPLLLLVAVAAVLRAVVVSGTGQFLAWVLLAVYVGELGTELTSEDSHRWVATPGGGTDPLLVRAGVTAAAGVVVVLIGFGLLAAIGVDPNAALVVFGLLGLLVLMASIDSDSVLIVAFVAIVLAVAIQPADEALDPRTAPAPGRPYFVVLGDSYISGEGAQRFISGTNTKDAGADPSHVNGCRRARTAWPFLLAGDDPRPRGVPKRVLFLACSGAVSENIHTRTYRDDRGKVSGPAELALFRRSPMHAQKPAFVLVSIGGNDAGFGELGQSCIGPGDCTEVGQQFLDDPARAGSPQPVFGAPPPGHPEPLAAIGDNLDAAYSRIRNTFGPDVPVVVAPYPLPFAGAAHCNGTLFTRDERLFIDGFTHTLDRVITRAAQRHRFLVIDTLEQALVSSHLALCDGSGLDSGLNLIAANPQGGDLRDRLDPRNWIHNSLHPNEDGHRALAATARDWFRHHPRLAFVQGAPARDAIPKLSALLGGRQVVQCGNGPECEIRGGHWLMAQVRAIYSRGIGPMAVTTIGLWMLVLPATWVTRRRRWSLARVSEDAWTASAWFRSRLRGARVASVVGLVTVVVLVMRAMAPWVGLDAGYGSAQSRGSAWLMTHPHEWVSWIDGTTRDIALYIPLYVVLFVIVIMLTSRIGPARRWSRRWEGGVLSDGAAALVVVGMAVADLVETALFRHTLIRLQAGDAASTLSGWTTVTSGFTAAKTAFGVAFAALVVVRVLRTPAAETADGHHAGAEPPPE